MWQEPQGAIGTQLVARLRLVADAYRLDRDGRAELLAAMDDAIARIEAAVWPPPRPGWRSPGLPATSPSRRGHPRRPPDQGDHPPGLNLRAKLVGMRHARPDDLVLLEPLLEQLRGFDQLVERTPGSFYRKSKGFLHFHIDGDDIWCDVKLTGSSFGRVRVTTEAEQRKLVSEVRRALEA